MFSRYIVYHILSGNRTTDNTCRELFGKPSVSTYDVFGDSLSTLRKALPIEDEVVDEWLEKSTLFGLYSSVLTDSIRNAWKEDHLQHGSSRLSKYVGASSSLRVKTIRHFCKKCVHDDITAFGIAYWRLIHQIPAVHYCPVHLSPLQGLCARCQQPVATRRLWYPPSQECPHCGNDSFISEKFTTSPARKIFMDLLPRVLKGETWMLKPEARLAIYKSHFGEDVFLQVGDRRLANFEELVLNQWNAQTLESLEADLGGTKVGRSFLKRAVMGTDITVNPIAHLALISALSTQHDLKQEKEFSPIANKTPELSSYLSAALQGLGISEHELINTLRQVALKEHLPIDICVKAAEGATRGTLNELSGIGDKRVPRLRESIAVALRGLTSDRNFSLAGLQRQILVFSLCEKHRTAVLAGVGSAIVGRGTLARTPSYLWCCKHDREWLEKTRTDVRTEYFRNRILQLRSQGSFSQKQIWIEDPPAFRWAVMHDGEWFTENVPEDHSEIISPEIRAKHRKSIIYALRRGAHELPHDAELWCLRNDLKWFQTIRRPPLSHREDTDISIPPDKICDIEKNKRRCREIIRKAILAGRTRRTLPTKARTWAINFDREWLDKMTSDLAAPSKGDLK